MVEGRALPDLTLGRSSWLLEIEESIVLRRLAWMVA